MPGHETYLVPEMFSFLLGGKPSTQVYLDAERFDGAKRGGSPNLAKLACACRLMHQLKGLSPKLNKLGLPDPNAEFGEWMDYELAKGWMWNEQGPSPIYWWMHFAPQLAFAMHGEGNAKSRSEDWIRQLFDVMELCDADGMIVQAGMRGAGHPDSDPILTWLFEYMRSGTQHNKYWAKYMEDNQLVLVIIEHEDTLRMLFSGMSHLRWPVRVEQHIYQYEHGTISIISKAGNGNTQERAMDAKIDGRPRAIFPVDGGFRKQGDLDDMACWLDEAQGIVFYRSALFTNNKVQSYHVEGAGKLLHHWVWDGTGLHAKEEQAPVPEPPATPPPAPPITPPRGTKEKWYHGWD